MTVRVRFAPSPTGQVHIGNIRAAIFNWLFARHQQGAFLLRIEDTDRERSTPEAIAALLEVMEWLGLDTDEPPLYQSSRQEAHLAAAARLVDQGHAYRHAKGGDAEATLFRIPWDADRVPGVSVVGPREIPVHSDVPVVADFSGLSFAQVSRRGKPVPTNACLAGFRDLEVIDGDGQCRLQLNREIDGVLRGQRVCRVDNPALLRFTRRQIAFEDCVKGPLAKPLDSMRDQVIVRSDGSPVFHLANVSDDVAQRITHIIRGDDHVENTYRHLFLFWALGEMAPAYGHLPMIVNAAGKPYSKRDGAAYVGDFRESGYLPEALLNHLSLLGWSPGDGREKLCRAELVDAFGLDRVQLAAAQMNLRKLDSLNAQYMAELPFEEFLQRAGAVAQGCEWAAAADDATYFASVAALMQSRLKCFGAIEDEWGYFFVELPAYDERACRKFLGKPGVDVLLKGMLARLDDLDFADEDAIRNAISDAAEDAEMASGKANQPLRVAVTGRTVGAGVYETLAVLGRERTRKRLSHALAVYGNVA